MRGTMSKQTVELIASGYEWVCSKCAADNKEIETAIDVTCKDCGTLFEVSDYHHATP